MGTDTQVYGWLNEDGSYYFVSKCLKGSEVPYQDKKHIKAPTDPTLIRILKEFEDEDESLDYLDACLYLMGFKSDGSGTLENSHDNIGSYRLKGRTSKPVTVYRVKDGSFVGDWSSVTDACDSLRISRNSGYASLDSNTTQVMVSITFCLFSLLFPRQNLYGCDK